jgi:hypothetical protein
MLSLVPRDVGNTTWYRERRSGTKVSSWVDPVASSSSVEPSQRAERSGLLPPWNSLRYVLIPRANRGPRDKIR